MREIIPHGEEFAAAALARLDDPGTEALWQARIRKAISAFQRASDAYPDNPVPRLYLAIAWMPVVSEILICFGSLGSRTTCCKRLAGFSVYAQHLSVGQGGPRSGAEHLLLFNSMGR